MPEPEITEKDRLALLGGIAVIRTYQRMIDETHKMVASIIGAEQEDVPYPYFGVLTDHILDDRMAPEPTVRNILRDHNVTVREDVSEDHVQRQEREAETR